MAISLIAAVAAMLVVTTPALASPTVVATTAPEAAEPAAAAAAVPAFDHIFFIIMENSHFDQIIGDPSAAYINSLLPRGALATNYFALTHPSLPNYLALVSGDPLLTEDCPPPTTCWFDVPNLAADRIEPSGRTWKAYLEDLPSSPTCFQGDRYPYVRKHNPFIFFNNVRTNPARCSRLVPYSNLMTDLASTATTPSYVWITPNMCHDMHEPCPPLMDDVKQGDQWLSQEVPNILNKPAFTQQRSLLVITWDEDDGAGDNRVAAIFLGSGTSVRAGYQSSIRYDHYSMLRTIEASWGLQPLSPKNSSMVPMSDLFTQPTASASASPVMGTAPSSVGFRASVSSGSPPYTYRWDFGDGTSSTEQNPNHTFSSPGSYTARLTVRDAGGLSAGARPLGLTVTPGRGSPCTIAFGLFQPNVPVAGSFEGYAAVEGQLSRHLAIAHWFQAWGTHPENDRNFHTDWAEAARQRGSVPMITWEPWDLTLPKTDTTYSLKTIVTGRLDGYIDSWGNAIKAYDGPLLLRFAHEMQGSHFPWGGGVVEGQTPQDYIAAWRYVHNRFRALGVTNVQWVWSPDSDQRDPDFLPMRLYYPGDDYADWLGTSMLNFGDKYPPWSIWAPLRQLMQPTYDELLAISASKPIMLAEVASWGTRTPAENATWLREAASTLQDFPRVKAVVWYDDLYTPYALDRSPEVMAAAREAFGSPAFCAALPWSSALAATAWASPAGGAAPLAVTFSGAASGGTSPYTYRWDFGDSTSSTEQNPVHSYSAAGRYMARLTVTDSSTASVTAPVAATANPVTVGPLAVTAFASSPRPGVPPLAVTFNGSAAGGMAPYWYQWDFGDGSALSTWSTDPRASHPYTARGSLKAVLTARDSKGVQAVAPYFLHIFVPLAVTATATPVSGIAPLEVGFTAGGGGGSPPYTAYYWDFGDGGFSTEQNPTHIYDAARTYVARVSLRDSAGGAGSASITITVTPAPGS